MNLPRILWPWLLTMTWAVGQEVKITSPDEAKTFIYGSVTQRRLHWKEKERILEAEVTFSNAGYSNDKEPPQNETYNFRLPGVVYDKDHEQFLAPDTHGKLVPVAERKKVLFVWTIRPLPQTVVRVIRLHGTAQVILESDSSALNQPASTNDTRNVPLDSILNH